MCKRLVGYLIILLVAAPVSAEAQTSQPSPSTSYTLFSYDKGDDAAGSGSRREMLLARALRDAPSESSKPLIEGWITTETYSRIYADRQIYFVLHLSTADTKAQVCQVGLIGLPSSIMFPDIASVGAGIDWCTAPRTIKATTSNSQHDNWPPRGRAGAATNMRSADGTPLRVLQLTDLKMLDRPLPPADIADVLTIGLFPGSRDNAKRSDRYLYVLRLRSGEWAMALKFHRSFGGDLSACFFLPARKAGTVPNEGWATPDIEDWCRKNADSYLASLPADQIPPTIVVARSHSPRDVQNDD